MRFLISSNPSALREALAGFAVTATVEAEYGDVCVVGTALTMAHHGIRAGQPAPCSYENGCGQGVEAVGLSHFDLDTLGGCAALLARKPESPDFWRLAEFVDLQGPHKLGQSGASEADLSALHAFWAWSQSCRVLPPRDGSVVDITDKVTDGIAILERILVQRDANLFARGEEFKAASVKLNAESFLEEVGGVAVRIAPAFVNHLYDTPQGVIAQAVVGFNTTTGGITVSFADAPKGANAREITQSLWGAEAGGHAGIAGSPRNRRMTLDDLVACRDRVVQAIRA